MSRAISTLVLLTVCDKLLALGKEALIAARFGLSSDLDVFNIALSAPGVIGLVISGALGAALVPRWCALKSTPAAFARSLRTLFWGYTLVAGLLAGMVALFAAQVFTLTGYGFGPEERALGALVQRTLAWLILLETPAAFALGALHAEKRFFGLSAAPLCMNLTLIGWLIFAPGMGVKALTLGTVVGVGVKMLVLLVLAKRNAGLTLFAPFRPDAAELKAFTLVVLPLVGGELVVNANLVVDQMMSAGLGEGAASALRYAYRINDLPIQVLFMALSRAVFPYISEQAATGDEAGFRAVFRSSLHFTVFIAVPTMIYTLLFAPDIVGVLLKRGAFDADACARTASTLRAFALGMPFYAYSFVNGAFATALGWVRTLFVAGVCTLVANVGLNLLFIRLFGGVQGVALSTGVCVAGVSVAFLILLEKRKRVLSAMGGCGRLGRFTAVAFLAGALAFAAALPASGAWTRFAVGTGVYGLVYVGFFLVVRDPDSSYALGALLPFLKRRIDRRP